MTNKGNHAVTRGSHRSKVILSILILCSVFALQPTPSVYAAATTTVEVLDLPVFPPDTIQVGQDLSFRVRYSCAAVGVGNCDNINIQVQLPDWFDETTAILDSGAPYTNITLSPTGLLTIEDVDPALVGGARLDPGESETATITLRVEDDAYDFTTLTPPANDVQTVTTTVTSDATDPPVLPPASDIALEPPDFNWEITKERILPPPTVLQPAVDQPVTYRVCLNPLTNIDNYVLEDFSFFDDFPNGAVIVSPAANPPDVVYSDEDLDGNDDRVTWNFNTSRSFRDGNLCRNMTVIYPSAAGFGTAPLDTVDNDAAFIVNTASGAPCPPTCSGTAPTINHGFDPEQSIPSYDKSIVGSPVGLTGTGRWQLRLNTTNSNAPTSQLVMLDELPSIDGGDGVPSADDILPLQVTQINLAQWNSVFGIDVRAAIEVSNTPTCRTDVTGTVGWTNIQGPGAFHDGSNVPGIPIVDPLVRCVRVTFEQDDGFGFTPGVPMNFSIGGNPFEILFEVRAANPAFVGDIFANCIDVTSSVGGGPSVTQPEDCATVEISGADNNVSLDTNKTIAPPNPSPDDPIVITLEMELTERASANLVDPRMADALPDNILIDQTTDFWDITYVNTGPGDVTLSEADIRNGVSGSGVSISPQTITALGETRDVLLFNLAGLDIAPPTTGVKVVRIEVFARIRPATTDGTYTNRAFFIDNGPGQKVCEDTAAPGDNGTVPDVDNIMGEGVTADLCVTDTDYDVPRTARFAGQKWLRNEYNGADEDRRDNIILAPGLTGTCEDGTTVTNGQLAVPFYTRNPCVHEGEFGDLFTYRITVQNTGNVILFDYHLYDLLPYEGDTGVSATQVGTSRESAWRAVMTPNGVTFFDSDLEPLTPAGNLPLTAADFIIEYTDSNNPCRPEVGVTAGCDAAAVWTTAPADWNLVSAFRILLNTGTGWEPGVRVEFVVEMQIPASDFYGPGDPNNPEPGGVAWNNFAHNFYELPGLNPSDLLAEAEPPRVGIMVKQTLSLGNYVWFDEGGGADTNNGFFDPGEQPAPGVRVELYEDTNGNGVFDGNDQFLEATVTDNTGVDDGFYLFDELPEGNYFVHIPGSNFTPGGPLHQYSSSSDTATPVDGFPDNRDHGIDEVDTIGRGISSPLIELRFNDEPTGEGTSSDPADGPNFIGNGPVDDDNSDLTVDFGFARQFDWGDNPDSYGTDATDTGGEGVGPSHLIIPTLRLGQTEDAEPQGQPSAASDGDDTSGSGDDEDGIDIPPLVAGQTQNVETTVFNNTGQPANLVGWFDFDNSGTYEPNEAVTVTVPSSPNPQTIVVPVTVPNTVAAVGNVYSRWRLTTDPINGNNPTGPANDGEVEDYQIPIYPPGLSIDKTDGRASVVTGQSTTYTITISNSAGSDRNDTTFTDNVPVGVPNGYVDTTVSWTCTALGGASCDGNSATAVATRTSADALPNNPWEINELIDLPPNSTIIYSVTATLNPNADGTVPITNTATVTNPANNPNSVSDTDVNGVIFDPPRGVKTGVVVGGDVVRWTMTWFNTGAAPQAATITDQIQAGQTFLGNLVCTEFGADTLQAPNGCTYDAATNTVTWRGTIGPEGPPDNDRVDISFDVRVASNGTFTNMATASAGAGAPVSATASGVVDVTTAGGGGALGGGDSGNSVISKSSSPAFARPGETVTWTISVVNPGQNPTQSVVVTDNVPPQFRILSATASTGTVTTNGQSFTLRASTLNPGENIVIQIRTVLLGTPVAGSAAACSPGGPQIIINEACVQLDNNELLCASAQLACRPPGLPETGQSPAWRMPVFFGGLAAVLMMLLGFGWIIYLWKRSSLT